MSVLIQVSDDGGKTLRRLGEKSKHVDNHWMWINPRDTRHYRVGCDGGIYESFDRAATWRFFDNLPVTQFYDIAVDDNGPWYNVYGGTQDNFTLGGPAKTRSAHGITNNDWFVAQGGDGFQCKVDPKDPNIVYAEAQYGALVRFDRRTSQRIGIQPQPGKGEPPLRWNWDSPLIVSPHLNTRVYFAANRVFRSDDRGDTWKAISDDLTRQLDRDTLPIFGKIPPTDAVAKHVSTSYYGNMTALTESPLKEGLLYAGTDDGLMQVYEGEGKWRKIEKFPGVPEKTYVSRLFASQHAEATVYAAFDNHKERQSRFQTVPAQERYRIGGKTWESVAGDLPESGSVLAFAEDHLDLNLLFAGTEFGLYFTNDGGKKWLRLKSGLPTIAVRDLAIQKQENDLVVGTFGRGFYVLDDYSPLRNLKPETLAKAATLYPVRNAQLYVRSRQFGGRGKAFLGETFFTANNPPFGATFTYYLKDALKTKKQQRQELEKKADKPHVATKDELRAEAEEEPPTVVLTIADESGREVRTLTGPVTAGFQRVSWDLRDPAAVLPKPRPPETDDFFFEEPTGPLVMPGRYSVTLSKRVEGKTEKLAGPVEFVVDVDGSTGMKPVDLKGLRDFQAQAVKLERAVSGALESANDLSRRLEDLRRAVDQFPGAKAEWQSSVRDFEKRNRAILRALRGDTVLRGRNENTPVSISERVEYIVDSSRFSLAKPTETQREAHKIADEEFTTELAKLRKIVKARAARSGKKPGSCGRVRGPPDDSPGMEGNVEPSG